MRGADVTIEVVEIGVTDARWQVETQASESVGMVTRVELGLLVLDARKVALESKAEC